MEQHEVRGIVIADDHYNGLGVIRSLGERGIAVYLILLSSGKTFIDKSKYVKETLYVKHDKSKIMNALEQLIVDNEYCIVFPLSDYTALLCDEYYKINVNLKLLIPNAQGLLGQLENKFVMSEIAKRAGLTVPEHIVIDLNEVFDINWNIYPAILKPLMSVEGRKTDIRTVTSSEELNAALYFYKENQYSRIMIERFIYSNDAHMLEILGYVKKDGSVHCTKTIQKIREFPIKNGSTSFAFITDEHVDVHYDKVCNMVKNTNYYGLFDIEFKYSNGKVYFIEMNFRNGAPAYALTCYGDNIAYEWLCDGTGIFRQEKKSNKIAKKKYFMCEHNDVINLLKGYVGFITWIKQYFQSLKLLNVLSDFHPTCSYYSIFVTSMLKKALKREIK